MTYEELLKNYKDVITVNQKYEAWSKMIAENLANYEKAAIESEERIARLLKENKVQKEQIEALEVEKAEIYAQIAKYKAMANELEDWKQKYLEIAQKVQSQGTVGFRKELTDELAAKILVKSVEGYDVNDVVAYIKKECNKVIPPAKVYRTISVKENNDLARMLAIYQENKSVFGGFTEEDIKKWFIHKRIKKLKLMDETELRFEYGAEIVNTVLPMIKQDQIVVGYYASEEFELYKRSHSKVEKASDYLDAISMLEL